MANVLWLENDFSYDRTQRHRKQRQEYLGLQVLIHNVLLSEVSPHWVRLGWKRPAASAA